MDVKQIVVFGLASVATGGVLYALAYPWLVDERAEKRQKSIFEAGPRVAANPRETALRRGQVAESLKDLEKKQENLRNPPLKTRIEQAGLTWSVKKYRVISAICALILAVLALVFSGSIYVVPVAAFVGWLGVPRWILKYLAKRRQKAFIKEFPNAIDIIVRGVKSGLPLGDCFRIVAAESQEPVKSEFRGVIEMQTVGMPLGEAVERLYTRLGLPEANFFAIVINIQSKSGGNLSEALGNLSNVLRERSKMLGKIQAMSAEAKASAWIIGSLPMIVGTLVYIVSPEYISQLWTRQVGYILLGVGAFWMSCGILTMRRMINFDF
ncbi:pilus assembly protein [Terrihabitans soli]|uniref:Pilus assembly protein n=1 Tax=Terrihabitans soli TaxID=708113 RepID=A0A6S6QSG5_9HYPH|nr:type II secretion system F family protein [Terrihabitans soli]BCJ92029.1 pilus assembly protein [Terrihabitans soli]